MAGRVPARLSATAGRRFGLTVGAAFAVLAGVLHFWRHAVVVPRVFGVLGITLLIAGLLIPTKLGPVERAWMKLSHILSRVTTPIFMSVIYFVVITPVGLLRRVMGKNALAHTVGNPGLAPNSYWSVRAEGKTRGDLKRQF